MTKSDIIEVIADTLEQEGFPSVADDIREGIPVDTVIERCRDVMTGDDLDNVIGILTNA